MKRLIIIDLNFKGFLSNWSFFSASVHFAFWILSRVFNRSIHQEKILFGNIKYKILETVIDASKTSYPKDSSRSRLRFLVASNDYLLNL